MFFFKKTPSLNSVLLESTKKDNSIYLIYCGEVTVSDDKFGILLKLVKGDFVGLDRFVDESSKLKYKTCIPRTMLLKLNLELLSEDNFQIFFKEIALKKASIIQKIKEGKSKVKNERLKIFENHRELREISKNKTVLINKIKNFRK